MDLPVDESLPDCMFLESFEERPISPFGTALPALPKGDDLMWQVFISLLLQWLALQQDSRLMWKESKGKALVTQQKKNVYKNETH